MKAHHWNEHALRDYGADRRLLLTTAMAVPIGLLGTLAAWVLLSLIRFFTNLFFFQTLSFADHAPATHTLGAWVIIVPVIGGLAVGLIARFGSEKIRGHGIPEAMEAILFGRSLMSPKVAVLKPLSSGIVIGSGGPFGAEGPIIMTGGAIGSLVGQLLELSSAERKALLVAGATAGMTAVFGTPMAAVLLGVELLLFELRPRSLLPVAIACAVAAFARPLLLDAGRLFPLQVGAASPLGFLSCVVLGLLAGGLSAVMSTALYRVEDIYHRLPIHWMWWPALGGIAVGVGGWLEPRALGVGYDVIADLLNQRLLMNAALALITVKAVIWLLALGSGTSGGVLAPLLMVGAGLGVVVSPWLGGASPLLWPLVAMAAVLAGSLGAPLTASVFAFGLTGDADVLLPLLTACMVSHGVNVLVMKRSIMTERIARRGRHVAREFGVDPQERLHVSDVMTAAVEAIPSTVAIDAAKDQWFGAGQKHRAYPVVDGAGRYLFMADRAVVFGAPPGAAVMADLLADGHPQAMALPGEICRSAASRMAALGLERLPVLDSPVTGRLVGIVSRSDLLKAVSGMHLEEALEAPRR